VKRIKKPKKLVQILQVVSSSWQSKALREREKRNNLMTFKIHYSKQKAFAAFLIFFTR
jgi:hypothetical protein